MSRLLINFQISQELNNEFEAKIKSMNQKAGRGTVLLHGDKTRFLTDALREWLASH